MKSIPQSDWYPDDMEQERRRGQGGGGAATPEMVKPRPNIWQWDLGSEGMEFNVPAAPNRIHRLMQRVVLGIRWRRI